jgi:hypothetical protein
MRGTDYEIETGAKVQRVPCSEQPGVAGCEERHQIEGLDLPGAEGSHVVCREHHRARGEALRRTGIPAFQQESTRKTRMGEAERRCLLKICPELKAPLGCWGLVRYSCTPKEDKFRAGKILTKTPAAQKGQREQKCKRISAHARRLKSCQMPPTEPRSCRCAWVLRPPESGRSPCAWPRRRPRPYSRPNWLRRRSCRRA